MAIPKWQAGTTYAPGALVVPSSGTITVATQPDNAGFESGDLSNWTDSSGLVTVIGYQPYEGSYCANATGGGVGQFANDTVFPVTAGQQVKASGPIRLTNAGSDDTSGQVNILWLNSDGALLNTSHGSAVSGHGGHWGVSSISANAPANAVSFQLAYGFNTGSHGGSVAFDKITLNYAYGGPPTGLAYKAVQASPGKSGSNEPAWPPVLGETVIDNEVTWEAVIGSMIVWEASPIMKSGDTEPTWPTSPGAIVHDGTIDWTAGTAQITDPNCPQSKIVAIAAGKVYAADNDIIRYCSTVNPLDWTSANDAGYLPFGLQTYGSNPVAAMGLYRSNLVPFNSEGFQMWQVDPDPANTTLLDALPVASTQNKALAPVANDLLFLSSQGVRSIGIAASSTNLQASDVGMPIDPLVKQAMDALAAGQEPRSVYLPALGQYWIAFNGDNQCSVFVYTINQVGQVGKWGRYEFPFPIDEFTQLNDRLYIRSSDDVLWLDDSVVQDYAGDPRAVNFDGTVQWPWLDLKSPGVMKQLIGFDLVGTGSPTVAIGYDQSNNGTFTTDFAVPADTVPGMIIPLPLMAPSMSVRVTYPGGQKWQLQAVNLYLQDQRVTS